MFRILRYKTETKIKTIHSAKAILYQKYTFNSIKNVFLFLKIASSLKTQS